MSPEQKIVEPPSGLRSFGVNTQALYYSPEPQVETQPSKESFFPHMNDDDEVINIEVQKWKPFRLKRNLKPEP